MSILLFCHLHDGENSTSFTAWYPFLLMCFFCTPLLADCLVFSVEILFGSVTVGQFNDISECCNLMAVAEKLL